MLVGSTDLSFLIFRNSMYQTNERLRKLLSDIVRQSGATEDTINRQLEGLIQETSKNEEHLSGSTMEMESATLYASKRPAQPGLMVTSTPAVGPSAPVVGFSATPGAGKPSVSQVVNIRTWTSNKMSSDQ